MRFAKPPLPIDEQIDLLARRGMQFRDREQTRHHLSHINYYRLRAYWLPYELAAGDGVHRFAEGTSFDDVLALYVFDRRLRLLLLDAIERLEISVRTRWAHTLALRHGAHPHLDRSLFAKPHRYERCLAALREEIGRSHETFVTHYRRRYTDPALPPIWAVCEVMSLGQLSQWLDNLKRRADRQEVAKVYQLDERVLCSFMHHLTHVRNLCAHHSRIWNRRFTFTMRLPRNPRHVAGWFSPAEPRKLYNTLTMLAYLLRVASPKSTWVAHVRELVAGCPQAHPPAMGFPEGWRSVPIWEEQS